MFEEIFHYEGYITFNEGEVVTYYNCRLLKQLGKYFIGTNFHSITFLNNVDDCSVLQLRRDEGVEIPVAQYRIHLKIGDLL